MKIQKAKLFDVQALALMNHRLIRDEGHRNPMNVSQLGKRMKTWIRKEYRAWIFRDGKGPVGYCLFREEKESVYVRQFFINKDFRRKGLGLKAFRWMAKNVWKNGKIIRLDVLVGNKKGIAFWKAAGFKDYCFTMERKNR